MNLDKLAALYPEGGEVTVEDLVAKGAVRKNSSSRSSAHGEISVALQVTVDAVLRLRQGEDHRRRRYRHRARLSPQASDDLSVPTGGARHIRGIPGAGRS